jgi:hypothetical protein
MERAWPINAPPFGLNDPLSQRINAQSLRAFGGP